MIDLLKGKGVVAIGCELIPEGIKAALVLVESECDRAIVVNPDNHEEKYPILIPGRGTFYGVVLDFDTSGRSLLV